MFGSLFSKNKNPVNRKNNPQIKGPQPNTKHTYILLAVPLRYIDMFVL